MNTNRIEEKKSLEKAIQDEALERISNIAVKEALELKRLDTAYAAELKVFKNRAEAETEAKIRQESSRVENRAGLNQRKSRLKSLEAFADRLVEETAKGIRETPGYKNFLLRSLAEALGKIPGNAEAGIKREDLVLEPWIREALAVSGIKNDLSIVEDKTIRWGGCIVREIKGGRIFDRSIERICFQKSAEIRRETMRILEDQSKRGRT